MKSVIISICTYRRPEELRELFKTLKDIRIPQDINLSVRIIDNEETPVARDLVEDIGTRMPWLAHYVHEKDPGIAPARNRALSEAQNEDFLVFVDDDETVSPEWLEELWAVQKRTNAHFVQGPVVPTVENEEDEWWIKSILFAQKTFPDGTPRHEAWTNNVMINMAFIREHNLRFDPALRFDGGEDTLFFREIIQQGGQGVFAANAVVYEVQPKGRLNWKWAISRQFRNGNTRAMCAKRLQSRLQATLHCLARSAACAGVGVVLLPLALIKGRIGVANSLAYIARSAGVFWGLLGKRYLEYERETEKAA